MRTFQSKCLPERLQRKYNAGKKWPGVPAGALRRGRRTREEIRQQNAERT